MVISSVPSLCHLEKSLCTFTCRVSWPFSQSFRHARVFTTVRGCRSNNTSRHNDLTTSVRVLGDRHQASLQPTSLGRSHSIRTSSYAVSYEPGAAPIDGSIYIYIFENTSASDFIPSQMHSSCR